MQQKKKIFEGIGEDWWRTEIAKLYRNCEKVNYKCLANSKVNTIAPSSRAAWCKMVTFFIPMNICNFGLNICATQFNFSFLINFFTSCVLQINKHLVCSNNIIFFLLQMRYIDTKRNNIFFLFQ